ncbi:MAG: glycerate kinase [Xanthobacteraceae bacterium]
MTQSARDLLERLFRTAVAAAHPRTCLPGKLPQPPAAGRLIILAAGKAAGSMTEVAERHYLDNDALPVKALTGLAVTRHGYGAQTRVVPVVEAGHPLPDAAGLAATERTLAIADTARADDRVLVLLSGGASANWVAPLGISFGEKQSVTRALLRSGASISEVNAVRKHLSRIKGGRLAARCHPAPIVTLAISDVPGDDPAVIGSGPTVPDPTTLAEAQAVVERYRLDLPPSVRAQLAESRNETPKPGDAIFERTTFALVARPADAFQAAAAAVEAAGYACVVLGDRLEGEAREVAASHAQLAREVQLQGRRTAILSGGELTVTLRGNGRGGPNQEYALALAVALEGALGIAALAADTDGTDGGSGNPEDPAGAFVDQTTLTRARARGLDPAAFLANNDSTGFFEALGDLLITGPTRTNVMDFRAILVDSP